MSATRQSVTSKKNLALFASGAGSNAHQIIRHFKNHPFIQVVLIVCNNPKAGVLSIAANEDIPYLLLEKERFFRGDGYVPVLQEKNIDYLILAGFLWKVPQTLISRYERRIINIHPALLPQYGGKGMYGAYVHQAVLNNAETKSGITIHYVDEQYDNGDTIFQATCDVTGEDTAETLSAKVQKLEHQHYPRVIEELLSATNH